MASDESKNEGGELRIAGPPQATDIRFDGDIGAGQILVEALKYTGRIERGTMAFMPTQQACTDAARAILRLTDDGARSVLRRRNGSRGRAGGPEGQRD